MMILRLSPNSTAVGTIPAVGAVDWLYFFGRHGASCRTLRRVTMMVLGRSALATLAVSSILLVSGRSAGAAVVTLAPSRDNSLFADGANRSCGIGPLFCGQTGGFGPRRALIGFDVSGSVPPGSTITSVEVGITVEGTGPAAVATDVYSLYRLNADWGEKASECGNGVGALAEVGDATWTHSQYPTVAWSTPGGDFQAAASASVAMPALVVVPTPATWTSQPGLVADVQLWLNQPLANFGWIIIGNEAVERNARELFSRESAFPPSLRIEFTAPPSSPPAVPDGIAGSPVLLSKLSADGADLGVAWDGTLCAGSFGHHVVYGTSGGFPVAPLGAYALAGSVCSIGASSPYVWIGSPDPAVLDPAKRLIWMLVLADDGTATEGSWGRNSASQERNGPGLDGSSSQCGILDKSVINTCGNGFLP
jgi:hypothetical protein